MLIPSGTVALCAGIASLSRRVNANSQLKAESIKFVSKLIKKGEC